MSPMILNFMAVLYLKETEFSAFLHRSWLCKHPSFSYYYTTHNFTC